MGDVHAIKPSGVVGLGIVCVDADEGVIRLVDLSKRERIEEVVPSDGGVFAEPMTGSRIWIGGVAGILSEIHVPHEKRVHFFGRSELRYFVENLDPPSVEADPPSREVAVDDLERGRIATGIFRKKVDHLDSPPRDRIRRDVVVFIVFED